MSRSQRLRLTDLRDLYRLAGECREVGGDPVTWRRHMLEGLCRLTGARLGIAGEIRDFGGAQPMPLMPTDAGSLDPADQARWRDFHTRYGLQGDATYERSCRIPGRLVTRDREQLVDDTEWYRSVQFNDYLDPCGVDGRIVSVYTLPDRDPRTVHGITLHGAADDRPFSGRQVRLVHWFHHELGRMFGRGLAMEADRPRLAPRLRQVLACLMQGDSEKQVARRLGISPHTVHTYIHRLHRLFDVQSRGELLARCRNMPPLPPVPEDGG